MSGTLMLGMELDSMSQSNPNPATCMHMVTLVTGTVHACAADQAVLPRVAELR